MEKVFIQSGMLITSKFKKDQKSISTNSFSNRHILLSITFTLDYRFIADKILDLSMLDINLTPVIPSRTTTPRSTRSDKKRKEKGTLHLRSLKRSSSYLT